MKQVFYSEKLNKYFDTKSECVEAEKSYEEANTAKEKEKAQRAEDAQNVEKAYKHSMEVRKEAAKIIEDANKMIDEADQEYFKARTEFINKYGSFHMSYYNHDGDETCVVSNVFEAFKELFKIPSNF